MKDMINRAFGLRGALTLLALMLAFAASAQNKITGKVVDEYDQPAIGANVVVKGTTQGVSTDLKRSRFRSRKATCWFSLTWAINPMR